MDNRLTMAGAADILLLEFTMVAVFRNTMRYQVYRARAGAPASHRALKTANFTLHHIMPYRYAATVGFVLEKLRGVIGGGDDPGGTRGRIDKVMNGLFVAGLVSAQGQSQTVHKSAWMGANLFMGPEGSWRLDDPHHGRETLKPCGFARPRWEILMRLADALETHFEMIETTGTKLAEGVLQDYEKARDNVTACWIAPKVSVDYDPSTGKAGWLTHGAGALLNALEALAKFGGNTPYLFDLTDWIIPLSDDKDWKKLFYGWNDGYVKKNVIEEATRAADRANKINWHRPSAITKVYSPEELLKQQTQQATRRAKLTTAPVDNQRWRAPKQVDADLTDITKDCRVFWKLRPLAMPWATLPAISANFRIGGTAT